MASEDNKKKNWQDVAMKRYIANIISTIILQYKLYNIICFLSKGYLQWVSKCSSRFLDIFVEEMCAYALGFWCDEKHYHLKNVTNIWKRTLKKKLENRLHL